VECGGKSSSLRCKKLSLVNISYDAKSDYVAMDENRHDSPVHDSTSDGFDLGNVI